MSADTRLRELLSEMAPPPEIAEDQVVAARAALHAAYRDGAPPQPSRRWQPSFAWATAAVAAVVVAAALLLPGASPPVDASLAQIARATRDLEPEQLPAGAFVYSQEASTSLASSQVEGGPQLFYLLPETLDQWVQGATEQRDTTVGRPTFFNSAHETAYYAGGLDLEDGVGQTRTDRHGDVSHLPDITKWSDDPATLRDQLAAELADDVDPVLDEDVRLILLVEELLDPSLNAPPLLRAALIEVVGSRGFDTTDMPDGSVLVSVAYEDPGLGSLVQELEFDEAGFLRASRLIAIEPGPDLPVPADTAIAQSTWSRPYIVDGPGVLPADR